jgi:phospholipase/carboxylesterase
LEETFRRCTIDPERLAIGGFSDGASYALSLGVANGDLFTHILAFSPGFISFSQRQGEPRIFISHGTEDPVLPIQRCSRRILPILQKAGYAVAYHEFNGGHTVPLSVVQEALSWLGAP